MSIFWYRLDIRRNLPSWLPIHLHTLQLLKKARACTRQFQLIRTSSLRSQLAITLNNRHPAVTTHHHSSSNLSRSPSIRHQLWSSHNSNLSRALYSTLFSRVSSSGVAVAAVDSLPSFWLVSHRLIHHYHGLLLIILFQTVRIFGCSLKIFAFYQFLQHPCTCLLLLLCGFLLILLPTA